jgi:nicotinamide-nucleotide amidase
MNDPRITLLAEELGRRLTAKAWQAATAESCTGGLVAGAITAIGGSSGWFERGFVTYSNEAKAEVLHVPPAILARHGAVSAETARAMAEGAIAASRAAVAVAVTGIAGPSGGSLEKPVGMVWFAWAVRGAATNAAVHVFPGDRAAVREASVRIALEGLIGRVGLPD